MQRPDVTSAQPGPEVGKGRDRAAWWRVLRGVIMVSKAVAATVHHDDLRSEDHEMSDSARVPTDRAGNQRPSPAFHSRGWRMGNAIVSVLARAGIGPIHLVTTRGRTTGRPHTCPVVPVDLDGRTWLVAPYGPVAWVHNARVAGQVTLRYGRHTRDYAVREAQPDEAGPVLKRYVQVASKTRTYFEATKDSPVADFVAEAHRHPVFELTLRTSRP